ncbi:MAG: hypothetical protein ACXWT3_13795 [Methylococcaceae bacterium]
MANSLLIHPNVPNSEYRLPAESRSHEDDCRAKPLYQSETASVGGIREWPYAGKRGSYSCKSSGRVVPLP